MTTTTDTKVFKSIMNGWTAETYFNIEGKDVEITTLKRYNGQIATFYQYGKRHDNGFSFMMFQDERATLVTEPGRATEKTVADQHTRAIHIFKQLKGI